jgi:hypothetical protein
MLAYLPHLKYRKVQCFPNQSLFPDDIHVTPNFQLLGTDSFLERNLEGILVLWVTPRIL